MPFLPLVEGRLDAPVRLIVYEDLQCKDCAWLRRKLDERLLPIFGERIAIEHRDFPLAKHGWAREAAIQARLAEAAGAGARFRREILADLSKVHEGNLAAWVAAFRARHAIPGVPDAQAYAAAAAAVDADLAEGQARGVAKTPTLFLGEKVFIEYIPLDELQASIEEALGQPASA